MTTFNKLLTNKQRLFGLGLAFLIRFVFIFRVGHIFDLNTFAAWGFNLHYFNGPDFLTHIWSDYLPLPLLFTKLIAWISLGFHSNFHLVWKLFLVLFEIILLFLISLFKPFNSRLLFGLLLFSPPLIINGALWGQLDTLVSLLLLLSFLLATYKHPYLSLLSFSLAFSLKSLVVLSLPFLVYLWKQQRSWKTIFSLFLIFFFILILPSLYFIPTLNVFLIAKFFLQRLLFQASVYPFTTLNAFNFWSLFGNFWSSDQVSVLGLDAHLFGLGLFALIYLSLIYRLFLLKTPRSQSLIKASILALLAFYTFATRMHERHLLYSLPLMLTVTNISYTLAFISLTLIFSLNNLASLFWSKHHQIWIWPTFLNHILSFVQVVTFLVIYLQFLKPGIFKQLYRFIRQHRFPLFLFLFAFSLRLFRLSYPQQMIFDEVYHAFTAKQFVQGDNLIAWEWWHQPPKGYAYEWTHPPLAKYGMVIGMLLFGQNAFGWRFGSALFGAMTVVLLYYLSLFWLKKPSSARLAAILFAIDGLSLVQSRVAMNDIYLLFFILLTLYLAYRQTWKLAALSFGLALASKWSALYLLFPLAILFFQRHSASVSTIVSGIRYITISSLIYLLLYLPFFLHHSWSQFLQLQSQMWYYHTHLQATHPYQSQPWQWLLGLRPVWYYTHSTSIHTINIYAQSNPLILISGLVLLTLLPLFWQSRLFIPFVSYLIFFLPWLFSPRIMFFYHYLPSLAFFYVLLAYTLSHIPKSYRLIILGIYSISSFVLLAPSIYALPLPKSYWQILFQLMPSWQ